MSIEPIPVRLSTQAAAANLRSVCRSSYPKFTKDRLDYYSHKRFQDFSSCGATWFERHGTLAVNLREPLKGWALRAAACVCLPGTLLTSIPTFFVLGILGPERHAEDMSPVRKHVRGFLLTVEAIKEGLLTGFTRANPAGRDFLIVQDVHTVACKRAELNAVRQELAFWERPWREVRRQVCARQSVQNALSGLRRLCSAVEADICRAEYEIRQSYVAAPTNNDDDAPPPYSKE